MPQRIQLRRTKGWRKPESAVVVARPSKFGNPFRAKPNPLMSEAGARAIVVSAFRAWLLDSDWVDCAAGEPDMAARRKAILDSLPELRGRDLACWCPLGHPCHADVLLEMANRPTKEQ